MSRSRKQAAIDALHRYGVDDARLEIEMMKLDLAEMKLTGQGQEIEDLEEIEVRSMAVAKRSLPRRKTLDVPIFREA